jgi:4-hydroxy-3-polyprenylbenzoate decarboxylase
MWQVGANVDPARDVVLADGPLDHLDHAPTRQFHGGKLGIDATAKGPAEGYERGWPDAIRMTDDVRDRVTSRWAEYGIALPGAATGDGRQTRKTRRFARSGRGGA